MPIIYDYDEIKRRLDALSNPPKPKAKEQKYWVGEGKPGPVHDIRLLQPQAQRLLTFSAKCAS